MDGCNDRLAFAVNGIFHLPKAQSPEYGECEDTNYDLALNTAVVGIERAAQFITEVARSPFAGSPTDHP